MISSAKVSFITKDTLFSLQMEAIPDTLNTTVRNGKYQIETLATGYKSVRETILLKKSDNLIIVRLIPIELDNVNVSWEGAIITIRDSTGGSKSFRHKR